MIETFVDVLARHARERPEALALVLPRGAAVLGWLPNAAEWYLLRLACEQAGLLWVPISASQGVRELRAILACVRPAVIFTPTGFRGRDYVAEAADACRGTRIDPVRVPVPEAALLRLEGPLLDAVAGGADRRRRGRHGVGIPSGRSG